MFPKDAFRRADERSDAEFYQRPRFVTHIDNPAIAAVTQLYREYFPPNGHILDLMSSWISHLPGDIRYAQVSGLGMNPQELAANDRLDNYLVQDLNENPVLPYADQSFDGAAICVSIDYLIQPVEVLKEVGRCLVSGAPVVITFSNRCFPTKAVAVWHALDNRGRVALVEKYLEAAQVFSPIEALDRSPAHGNDPLFAVTGFRIPE